ncbi:MAG: hypothetical protein COT84_07695 [Chlamydiae bacterium CG10_big_fil_rev_8_21_14_0_10_35_9]|nr:MAG: hypothetical protein COT84_07695 [Chlamydiae bacterium CG10_big_fil_rev_8_21_14_0_10_35_9]
MLQTLQARIEITLLLGLISVFICYFAWKKKFFSLPKDDSKEIQISLPHVILAFVIYLFSLIFIGPLLIKAISFKEPYLSEVALISYSNFLSLASASVFLILFYKKKYHSFDKSIHLTPNKNFLSDILVGFIAWVITIPLVLFLSQFLDLLTLVLFNVKKVPEQVAVRFLKSTMDSPLFFSLALFSVVFFAPFLEELLFRGFLQTWFKKFLGKYVAIFASSICFAFFHYSKHQGVGNISIIGALFPLAFFLGFIYERQRSLLAPISMHAIFNAMSVVNLIFFE